MSVLNIVELSVVLNTTLMKTTLNSTLDTLPGVQELLLDPPGFDGRFLTEPKPLPPTPVPFMLNVPSCSKKIRNLKK